MYCYIFQRVNIHKFKALHNEAPEHLKELFYRLSDTQNRELRNSKTDLHIPLLRTSSGQNSFAYSGVCIWNNLTYETTSNSFSALKAKIERLKKLKLPH